MPIAAGTRIGPYEIVAWLGAGGMGEVYRARDPRLARDVAIKLIPETFATDPSRLHRFEQEARAAGQLNHPNILAVYDVGTHAGAPYIVSELLEGESLGSRLKAGALLPRKAIDYARQTAEGLAAAHDKSLVHRDLKPDNLFITNHGRVKILDFGIAKLMVPGDDATRPTGFPTETAAGMVVGTAGYMSPEQVRGEAVDVRSDIFSFGAVFYEMLAGRPAFIRPTGAETLAAILKEDPPEPISANVTPALARMVSRCLEKTREARFQSARDLAFGLEFLSAENAAAAPAPARADRAVWLRHRAVPWVVTGALALALTGTAVWSLRPSPPPPALTRFPFSLPAGQLLDGSGAAHVVALSPDGAQMAYVATPSRLYLRSMSELDAKAIPGTEGHKGVREPVFSPDGRSIAFFSVADQALKRIAVTGGAVATICSADNPTGMSWGPHGIVFGQGSKGIMRVSSEGGNPQMIVRVKDGQLVHGPQLLPGGQHVLFTLATGAGSDRWDNAQIVVQSLKSEERKTLIKGGSDARYVPTGHIVYAVSGSLYAVAFDAQQLVVSGSSVPIVEGVSRAAGTTAELPTSGGANFSFSSTGSLVYVPGPISVSWALKDITLQDRQGSSKPLNLPPGPYAAPRVSPDGNRIAFGHDAGSEGIIWIYDLSGTSPMRRLASEGRHRFPIWTGNGRRVVFQSNHEGDEAIFWQDADGTGKPERLTRPGQGESHAPESWHPKVDVLLYTITKGSDVSLWTLSLQDRTPKPFVESLDPVGAVFSPDGRWVAYSITERGRTTIYVQPFPATGDRSQLVPNGADLPHHPRWSPDGKELFYNPRPRGFGSVSITTHPTFTFGHPVTVTKVFQGGPPHSRTSYDIVPDGKFAGQFVGLISAGQTEHVLGSVSQINVVLNWFKELKAKVAR